MAATTADRVRSRAEHPALALALALLMTACGGADGDPAPTGGPLGGASVGGSAAAGANGDGMSGTGAGVAAGARAGEGGSATVGGGGMGGAEGTIAGQGGAAWVGGSGSGGGAGSGGGGAAGAGGVAMSVPYPPAANAGDVAEGVEQLNRFRATLGLSPVTFDAASSDGCAGHLQYLIEEAAKRNQSGYLEHTELNHANSHYSVQNEQAGLASDIAWGHSFGPAGVKDQSLAEAVDVWINAVYHRTPLLNPGLVQVGAASIQGYNCLNYNAPGNTTPRKLPQPVLWPAPGMTDVPLAFHGSETPCPTHPANPLAPGQCEAAGFIISANYYNWGANGASAITSVSKVTLVNTSSQAPAPLLTWYADGVAGHDPARFYVRDQIVLVPQAALDTNTTYRVEISAVINGSPTPLSWSFTTGTRSD